MPNFEQPGQYTQLLQSNEVFGSSQKLLFFLELVASRISTFLTAPLVSELGSTMHILMSFQPPNVLLNSISFLMQEACSKPGGKISGQAEKKKSAVTNNLLGEGDTEISS